MPYQFTVHFHFTANGMTGQAASKVVFSFCQLHISHGLYSKYNKTVFSAPTMLWSQFLTDKSHLIAQHNTVCGPSRVA